jgi:membrane-associated phospholipid phosphatase
LAKRNLTEALSHNLVARRAADIDNVATIGLASGPHRLSCCESCSGVFDVIGRDRRNPIFAAGVAWGHDQDWTGVAQLGVGTLATVGTAYGLKQIVHEERPDHSDDQSFPSDTAALAFAPAAFLWDRYGWQWGVPAYAAAAFVGWTRVDAKKHHWYDVAASAGIAWGYSQIFTTEYRRTHAVSSDLYATPDGAYVRVSYNF